MRKTLKNTAKTLLTALSACFLTACAMSTPYVAPSQNYVLNGKNLHISGVLTESHDAILGGTGYTDMFGKKMGVELTVTINGMTVVHGYLDKNASGELSGLYKGHDVTALCSSELKTANWLQVTCPILIDQKRTVTLVL